MENFLLTTKTIQHMEKQIFFKNDSFSITRRLEEDIFLAFKHRDSK